MAAKLVGINKKNYHTLLILAVNRVGDWDGVGWGESIKKGKLISKVFFLIMVTEFLY